ncbi:UNKNOWN [Stylonychia lemnae]|uniref:Uncharacterized protein n=1 Tax=Stylonychia lemnae TaxID=5949 RepID=A0A078AR86_STYLE|nr:UNKNOWN [Stylonychia lemnae]|eukprot:CDW83757.1 UNKNOWN [Stylonychia lemnae]
MPKEIVTEINNRINDNINVNINNKSQELFLLQPGKNSKSLFKPRKLSSNFKRQRRNLKQTQSSESYAEEFSNIGGNNPINQNEENGDSSNQHQQIQRPRISVTEMKLSNPGARVSRIDKISEVLQQQKIQTYNEWKECTKDIYKYVIQRTEEELKVVDQFYKRKPDFLRTDEDPILSDILEEEFRHQIQILREKQIRERNNDEVKPSEFFKHLMDLVKRYRMKLRGDKELAFENILINMMNEDYNAYYEYKKKHNFLDLEKKNKLKDTTILENFDQQAGQGQNQTTWKNRQYEVNDILYEENELQQIQHRQSNVHKGFSKLVHLMEDKLESSRAQNGKFMKYIQRIQKLKNVREQRLAKQRGYREPTSPSPSLKKAKKISEMSESASQSKGVNPLIYPQNELQFDFQHLVLSNPDLSVKKPGEQIETRFQTKRISVDQANMPLSQKNYPAKHQRNNNSQFQQDSRFFHSRKSIQDINLIGGEKFQFSDQSTRIDSNQNRQNIQRMQAKFIRSNVELPIRQTQQSQRVPRNAFSPKQSPINTTATDFYKRNLDQINKKLNFSCIISPELQPKIPILRSRQQSQYQSTQPQSSSYSEQRVKFQAQTPKVKDMKDRIKQHPIKEDSFRIQVRKDKEEISEKLKDIKKSIADFTVQFKEDPQQNFQNQYALKMFQEDIRFENIKNSIKIYDVIEHAKKPKQQKLLYFYHVNSRDEINAETKLIKNEVRQGITDPVRTAAIIELQNFIKKNVGNKKVMSRIAEESTHKMMVSSKNKRALNEIAALIESEFENKNNPRRDILSL